MPLPKRPQKEEMLGQHSSSAVLHCCKSNEGQDGWHTAGHVGVVPRKNLDFCTSTSTALKRIPVLRGHSEATSDHSLPRGSPRNQKPPRSTGVVRSPRFSTTSQSADALVSANARTARAASTKAISIPDDRTHGENSEYCGTRGGTDQFTLPQS